MGYYTREARGCEEAAETREHLQAFAMRYSPSGSSCFPFTAETAAGEALLSAYLRPSAGLLEESPSKTAQFSNRTADSPNQCPEPSRAARPILLIQSPRELLAYRNALPPVYVHSRFCGDTRFNCTSWETSHQDSPAADCAPGCCDSFSASNTCASASKRCTTLFARDLSPCHYGDWQKRARSSQCSPSTVESVHEGYFTAHKVIQRPRQESVHSSHDCCEANAAGEQCCSDQEKEEDAIERSASSCVAKNINLCMQDARHSSLTNSGQLNRHGEYDPPKKYLRRRRISLVPTLGGLHNGHLHLMRQAACLGDEVWVSIFLNPLQFQSAIDFIVYPACIDEDIHMLQQAGVVSVLFVPQREALFPLDAPPCFPRPAAQNSFFTFSAGPAGVSCCSSPGVASICRSASGRQPAENAAEEQGKKAQRKEALCSCFAPAEEPLLSNADPVHVTADGGSQGTPTRRIVTLSSQLLSKAHPLKCLQSTAAALTPQHRGEDGEAQVRSPSLSASSTTSTTPRAVVVSASHECEYCFSSGQQEQRNPDEGSRLFRMRVYFKDIEDVEGEGRRRNGFFGGIGTVVSQLLTLTRPTYLHAGLKDFQQVVCFKRLICGLGSDALVVSHSTQRDACDGLCLSSRNARLTPTERTAVAKYYPILQQLCQSFERGERRLHELEREVRSHAAGARLHLYYLTFDRWQDGRPVAYRRNNDHIGIKQLSSSTRDASSGADAVSVLSFSSSAAAKSQKPSTPQPQELLHLQPQCQIKKTGVQRSRHQLKSGAQKFERPEDHVQKQEHEQTWHLESPGKYCVTVAFRGNAETTIVDNVTLTDQAEYGDLLPPPLNAPWDRGCAATKHFFFSSFLLLGSLGMHLRSIAKKDLDKLLRAEEQELRPRSDAPQLLLSVPGIHAAPEAWQQRPEGGKNLICLSSRLPSAAADAETRASCMGQQLKRQFITNEGTEKTSRRLDVLTWLQRKQSACFEVEEKGSGKTLWLRKGDATLKDTAPRECACIASCSHGDISLHSVSSDNNRRREVSACRVRALGLFKYELRDEWRSSGRCVVREAGGDSSKSVAAAGCMSLESIGALKRDEEGPVDGKEVTKEESILESSRNKANSTDPDAARAAVADEDRCSGQVGVSFYKTKNTKGSAAHEKRERLIGYVWAEEAVGGEAGTGLQQTEELEGCNLRENIHTVLRVKHVFLQRERRRRTLGTHLVRAFLAATYKRMLQEQQIVSAVPPLRVQQQETAAMILAQRQQEGAATFAHGQQQLKQEALFAASREVPRIGGTDKGRPRQCENVDTEASELRGRENEEERQEKVGTGTAKREVRKDGGEGRMSVVEAQEERKVERETAEENDAGFACMVQLENVPHYLVDVLREGGFCVAPRAAGSHAHSFKEGCCMHLSLAHWYKTCVLNANV